MLPFSVMQRVAISLAFLINQLTDSARSAFTHLGLWRKLYDCSIASLHNQPVYPKMCSVDILFSSASNRLIEILKADFSIPSLRIRGKCGAGDGLLKFRNRFLPLH